ncbi:hypothetical protein WJX84_007868 [Apatococcus fuscideae]|uniref:UBA domain-containing protein n=1 Tax=Apatococcus fuscideae TaxID=2026836 RepID=A0AAW1SSI8_9CHLO
MALNLQGYDALKKVDAAKAETANEDNRGVGGDESVSELLSRDIFSDYRSRSVSRGCTHPGAIAEAASLSAITLPESSYPLWDSLPEETVTKGKLSQLQLEGVLYACTKHQQFLPNGQRAGFFIGDGAGVGKGRQIAGIMLDNYARGRRRHLWLSTSSDLHLDAQRDLRNIGCHINVINNCQTLDKEQKVVGLPKDLKEGVLFMTYSTLVMKHKGQGSRLLQVIDWLGGPTFDGCIVLDEAHKAKSFVPGKEAQSSKVASSVLELQERLPASRVVYCSATGVSEVGNMAYMSRLGLWGPGSAFNDFQAFLDSMKKRGVSFLEMLAMEMKAQGYYVARGLSFRSAEFSELEARLTTAQTTFYNDAVSLWQDLRLQLTAALDRTATTSRDVWKSYWAAQQRFFKLMCVSFKVPVVAAEAQKALVGGFAVVIGLQTTGEAAAESMGLQPGQACGFASTTRELLQRFVDIHFPTKAEPKDGQAAQDEPESVRIKREMLARVNALELPANFLDELIDHLGGPSAVAEMTGRRGRIVRKGRLGVFELRAKPDSSEMDSLNVNETAAFMRGDKLVAIVSDAASTGISLHASADAQNQRRRIHLTIELPWSADKAIQQLGRSHRSNQVHAPIYKLVFTNLGGEKRFAAAVARRLQSLGALTRGDRRAASGIDLSESNFDSPLGRKSLRRMYDAIVQGSPALPSGVTLTSILGDCLRDEGEIVQKVLDRLPGSGTVNQAQQIPAVECLHQELRDCVDIMGVGSAMPRSDTVAEDTTTPGPTTSAPSKDMGDVRRFLNRLLGLPVSQQNLLFSYFEKTLVAEIQAAKSEGRYFEGVSDLSGSNISERPTPQVLWVDVHSGLRTLRTDLTMDRGLSFEVAKAKAARESMPSDRSGFRRSRQPMFGRSMYILALQKPGQPNLFSICRPNTGVSYFDMESDELNSKYQRISEEEAQEGWEDVYDASFRACMHGPGCQQGPDCQVGRRLTSITILSGSVVRVWGTLESLLERHQGMLSRNDRTMRCARVEFKDGDDVTALIGVRYPAQLLGDVVATLSKAQELISAPTQVEGAPVLQKATLEAAAMGAGGAIRAEPPTPVDKKSLAKALRPPQTMLNFFKPKAAPGAPPSTKRKSSELGKLAPSMAGTAAKQQAEQALGQSAITEAESLATAGPGSGSGKHWGRQELGPPLPNGVSRQHADSLIAMGFSQTQASRALLATQGDLPRAINWILQS